MKKKKRLFAILLAFCVTFTMMPLTGSGGGWRMLRTEPPRTLL